MSQYTFVQEVAAHVPGSVTLPTVYTSGREY
jgi:hypothetical protein